MNKFLLLSFSFLLFFSCSNSEDSDITPNSASSWLIPTNEVLDGGPGKDGIPSIDRPNFSSVSEIDFLDENDLVIGVIRDGVAKAYPHPILDWHEIVNDDIVDESLAITYCPLTGTAIAWDRNLPSGKTTFGVSGKLYNTNLMPFDRATDSYWSQIRLDCVNGDLLNTRIKTSPVLETSWSTWKKMYPQSLVLNTNTGFNRDYQRYPYGDYRTNDNNIIFPISNSDTRLPAKTRVLGILEEAQNKAYNIETLNNPTLINDQINGQDIVVIGSNELNFISAFYNPENLDFEIDLSNLPIIARDAAGNALSISGEIIDGPLSGTKLNQPEQFIGYWFSFGTFYEDIEIFQG